MRRVTEESFDKVLAYMGDDLPNCLYLYGDMVRYGIDDPNMTVWYGEKAGKINAVVMKYFTGAHVYSKHLDHDLDEVVAKLMEIKADRISSQREIAEVLYSRLQEMYGVEYGYVFRLKKYRELRSPVKIERASAADAGKIAKLLMTSDYFARSYREEKLAEELEDRLRRGIGRSYIMRDGERIIGHDGVNLETDSYAVESLAMVHADYRNTLYGAFLESFMVNDLGKEGKDLYCMLVSERRIKAFEKMGNEPCAAYGKLYRRGIS